MLTSEELRQIVDRLLPFRSERFTMGDDTAVTIVPKLQSGLLFLVLVDLPAEFQGIVGYDVNSGGASASLLDSTTVPAPQEGLVVTTGVLTGTTGTDEKFIISAHTDGKLYLENRTGNTLNVHWFTMF